MERATTVLLITSMQQHGDVMHYLLCSLCESTKKNVTCAQGGVIKTMHWDWGYLGYVS